LEYETQQQKTERKCKKKLEQLERLHVSLLMLSGITPSLSKLSKQEPGFKSMNTRQVSGNVVKTEPTT
jgi:hypothetical protein